MKRKSCGAAGKKRGQLFSLDLLFAFSAVLFLFVAMVIVSDMLYYSFQAAGTKAEMRDAALAAVDSLVSTSGTPSNWSDLTELDSATVKGLGLAKEKGVLDSEKVKKFFEMVNTTTLNSNYSNASFLLGLGRAGYNFSVAVYNSSNVRIYFTSASAAPDASNLTASMHRYVLLGDELVRVNLRV